MLCYLICMYILVSLKELLDDWVMVVKMITVNCAAHKCKFRVNVSCQAIEIPVNMKINTL